MAVQGICLECQRTVHLADGDEPVCPVCGSRVMGPQIEESRLKRIGKNEAAFKGFNQARAKEQQTSILDLVCECGDTTCTDELEMKAAEYHPVRRHPTRFVVLPGHEIPAAESVVERAPGYYIVEKRVLRKRAPRRPSKPRSARPGSRCREDAVAPRPRPHPNEARP